MTIEEIIEELNNADNLLKEVVKYIIGYGSVSASVLQRKFAIGYSRAARIMDKLEELEFITEFSGEKRREIIITPELFEKVFGEKFETKKD